MKRYLQNNVVKTLIDAGIAATALVLAYELRYEGHVPHPDDVQQFALLVPVAFLRIIAGLAFGASKQRWRYFSLTDSIRILYADAAVVLVLLGFRSAFPRTSFLFVPLGVIALQFLISLASSIGIRVLWRNVCHHALQSRNSFSARKLLVLGAGYHGLTVAQEMAGSKGVGVIGFLDDDPRKIGKLIAGFPVLGPIDSLPEALKVHEVDDVLVCLPPSARTSLALSRVIEGSRVRMRIVPTIQELVQEELRSTLPVKRVSKPACISIERSRLIAPFSNKKILITGGAGFIGSSLAERLVEKNRLILFDQAFREKPIEYTDLLNHPNIEAVEGDILHEKDLLRICRDVDMVVHTAAVLGVGRVCGASRETLETNYVGTSRLLKALEGNKRLERFVYFSTSEVFGVNSFRVDESTPPSVGPIAEARWSYAISKLAGEHLVKSYYREARLPVTIVRPFNIFGPRRSGDYALRQFILNALSNKPLEVHGDGSQIRAWCFIDDFCDAMVAMLSRPEAIGEDFNIGNPANTLTILELARKVIELSDSSSEIRMIAHPFPDISIRVPSLTKAHTLLGYYPKFDLATGLAATIEWHRKALTEAAALSSTYEVGARAAIAATGT
jgi:dTDP-glucose 4,6-dehydratase